MQVRTFNGELHSFPQGTLAREVKSAISPDTPPHHLRFINEKMGLQHLLGSEPVPSGSYTLIKQQRKALPQPKAKT